MRLENKICAITGAGGGIGSVICKQFVAEGAAVVIAVDLFADAVEAWKAGDPMYDKVIPYTANIGSEQEVKVLVQYAKKNYGRIDVLVNSAGIEFNEKIGMISYANMEKTFTVNVFGLIELSQQQSVLDFLKAYGVEYPSETFEMDKLGAMFVALVSQGTMFFFLRLLINEWLINKLR